MDFTAFDLRIGTVTHAALSDGALALTVDLGAGRTGASLAAITEAYSPETIVGRQVVVVTNLPGAGEVIVLAALSPTDGAVLIGPERTVANGTQVV